jgi:prepilin-type N-terminal cleavage/methylation domain-containing protein
MIFRAKNKGFTLIDILIVISVVAVIAVLTIPNLLAKYQEKQTVEKLSLTYAKLVEVFQLMIEENGTIDTYGDTIATRGAKIKSLFPKYMKVRACNKYEDCVSNAVGWYVLRNGNNTVLSPYDKSSGYKAYQNLNGITFIVGTSGGSECYLNKNNVYSSKYGTYWGDCGKMYVDLNGSQKPNRSDKDMFLFKIVTDGILPAGSPKEPMSAEQCLTTKGTASLGRCTAWVLKNKNLDYLHCNDLNWTTQTKCK